MTKTVITREQAFFRTTDAVVSEEDGVAYGDALVEAEDCFIEVVHHPDRAPEVVGIVFGKED